MKLIELFLRWLRGIFKPEDGPPPKQRTQDGPPPAPPPKK